MKIAVRWPKGVIRLTIALSDQVTSIIRQISEKLDIDPRLIVIYYDEPLTKPIPTTGNIANARLSNGQFIYAKILTKLPDVPVATMTKPIDVHDKFLEPGEEMSPQLKRLRADYGTRTVTPAFLEHRESLKPSITQQDESSCYAIRVGDEAFKRFRLVALQTGFATHRICFLFGRINTITGKVTVHAGCEPQQSNFADHVEISPQFDPTIPLEIASQFGMQCVGMAISHQTVNNRPMAPYMVRLAAQYQNLFGEYFTTIVVTPMGDGDVNVEAFQVTDAAMKLDMQSYFVDNDSPDDVYCKEPIKVFEKKVDHYDYKLLLVGVRIRGRKSKIPFHSFPFPSNFPSLIDLKRHFEDNEFCPSWYKLFDFNLLIFLVNSNILSLENDIPQVISSIIAKEDVPDRIMTKITNAIRTI